jgi:hypothetical protein
MFNVIRNNMYRPQWRPLIVEAQNTCNTPNEQPLTEATV